MRRAQLAEHILPCSATMVGVCLTSIGLVKILEERIGPSHVDEYLAIDSILFLVSAMCAYLSLRHHFQKRAATLLYACADCAFIGGLVVMGVIATLFAYETI